MIKRRGDRGQPCLIPLLNSKYSEKYPLLLTHDCILVIKDFNPLNETCIKIESF